MKKVKKAVTSTLVLLIMFFCFVCSGCNSSESTKANMEANEVTAENSATEETFTIGWSVYDAAREFFMSMQEGVLAKAAELGINVITHDQRGNTSEMITGAYDLIAQDIDALVISPVNPEAMIIVSNLAREAGIPIIVVDVGTGGADVDAFIVSDSYGGGVLAAEYALRLIREHNLTSTNAAIIKVEQTSVYAILRGEAFKRVMTDSGYEIVAQVTANSDPIQAYEAMKVILETYGDDLAVVFSENDRMALGAAQAINEAGKTGQIMVIGFDGDPAAIDAINDDLLQGTIAQQPFEMGALGTELAYTLLTGGTITYDDRETKELYVEVYLIDETGTIRSILQ